FERLRRMQLILFLFFIAVPIAEIAIFIQAGELIGILPTIAITIGTAIAGSFLMRVQGFAALNRFAEAANRGEMPLTPVIDGIGILCAGLLLLTPGLLTDTIGLLLFVPPVRRGLARWVFRRAVQSGKVKFATFSQSQTHGSDPRYTGGGTSSFKKPNNDNVVDAEFETISPDDQAEDVTPLDSKDDDNPKTRKDTPWRRR
ncbi:MAG TPA: FxsA family protein, partial [Hyphomicrobiales bacterium]|nr:FxsA family protein [Hyphomicrobiales bacterium]